MGFKLGKRSLAELDGVHPRLVSVVERAIDLSVVDFSVHDGIRTLAEQEELVRSGASHLLRSKHLKQQATGFGHAVDLVPYIGGKLRWEWPPIYKIAMAVKIAADGLNVRLRWGGSWSELTNTPKDPELLQAEYLSRKRHAGERPFSDGPHYELIL